MPRPRSGTNTIKEDADYGFDQADHTGSGSGVIYYEQARSGFPLLLLRRGGLNWTISFFTGNSPSNVIEELAIT